MDLRAELPKTIPHAPGRNKNPVPMDVDKFKDINGCGSNASLNFGPFSGVNTMYDNTNELVGGTAKSNAYTTNPLGSSLSNFVSLDLDEWIFSRHQGGNLWNPNSLEIPTPPDITQNHWRANSMTHQSDKITFDNNSSSTADNRGHDCTREAHDLLNSLSFSNLSKMATSGTAECIPLDHVLRINREAVERLFRLLNCSCARSPHLALLYASIFSRMLTWYQQAAGIPTGSMMDMDTTPHSATTLSRSTSTDTLPLAWSSTAATPDNGNNLAISQAPNLGVVHTQMAMGTFNIDDQCVQAALNLQLVLSEMKRASCVIDLFSLSGSHNSHNQANHGSSAFGGVDGLYRSLGSWMKGEHTRIIGIMRTRLRELSDNIHS